MRKKLFLGILLLLTTSVVIYSCRKDTGLFSDDQTVSASADDLESSKIYHAKFATLNASTYKQLFASEDKVAMAEGSAAKKHDFIKLAPVWKKAYTLKTSSGAALIVVPTIEKKLDGKDFQVKRFFLFTKKGSGISDGKIIEVLGLHYALDDKINDILSGYDSNSYADLNGAIFLYDLNYFRLRGDVIKAGKPTGVRASLYNLPSAKKSIDGKVTNGYYDTGTPGTNGCQTLWYCDGNGTGITCWNQGYVDGSCYPPTGVPSGSDSGYDSSSGGGGGGGSYGGNTPPPPSVTARNIVDSLKNPCLKNVLNTLENGDLKSDITTLFRQTFKTNDLVDIEFYEDPNLASNTAGKTTQFVSGDYVRLEVKLNITMLANASKEYIAETMIHEILHGYLDVTRTRAPYVNPELLQHIEMAEDYVNKVTLALKEAFPGLSTGDAQAIVLSGFGQIQELQPTYFNTLLGRYHTDTNKVKQTGDAFKNKSKGTSCN